MFTRQKKLLGIIFLVILLVVVTASFAGTSAIDYENGATVFEHMIPEKVQREMEAQEPALEAYKTN